MKSIPFSFIAALLLACCLLSSSVQAFSGPAFYQTKSTHISQHKTAPSPSSPTFPVAVSSSIISTTVLFGKKAARAEGNDRKNKTERVRKQKDDVIEVDAVVLESLPNAMFRFQIDGAPETQAPVLATISGKIRKNFVKILVGDKVEIELSPYDLTRGRITFRHR